MDYSIEIKVEGNILIATVAGELGEKAYLAMRDQVRASLERLGAQHILLDIRHVVLWASLTEIFMTAVSNVGVIPKGTKYAIVYSEQTVSEANAQFGELVARNRGGQLRAFTDMALARGWLSAPDMV